MGPEADALVGLVSQLRLGAEVGFDGRDTSTASSAADRQTNIPQDDNSPRYGIPLAFKAQSYEYW